MNLAPEYIREQRERRVEALRAQIIAILPEPCAFVFEIGCGHGHYLTAYGSAHKELPCIGIDLVTKRIEKGNSKVEKRDLAHIHFLKAELTEFLDALPQGYTFARVFMLFPDPWPKKRHFKNRMVQTPLLDTLAARMEKGAQFCFRTDHEGYFEWTREHLDAHPQWEINPVTQWPFEERSFFQDLMESWNSLIAVRI